MPATNPVDAAENAVAIDQPNGMRVQITAGFQGLAIRITNTAGAPHAVTVKASQSTGNKRAVYGAAGPSGSNPTEPDYNTTPIPATTGVRWLVVPLHFLLSDNAINLDFEAGHTGTVSAVEVP